ncbi:hypothetical protein Tco_0571256 [Tanacetum coccineum]
MMIMPTMMMINRTKRASLLSCDAYYVKGKISDKIDLTKERWETEEDALKEFAKDYQLCWNVYNPYGGLQTVYNFTPPICTKIYAHKEELLPADSKDDLHGFNNEENLNTGEEMDTDLPPTTEEEPQPTEHHSPSPEPSKHESPKPTKQHESSKRHKKSKKYKKPDASPEPSDSKSSSTSLAYKGFDNYVPTTERVLANTLQGFNELLYAQI